MVMMAGLWLCSCIKIMPAGPNEKLQELLTFIEGITDGTYWDKIASRSSKLRYGVGLKRERLFFAKKIIK
jgi:hypothetical protein